MPRRRKRPLGLASTDEKTIGQRLKMLRSRRGLTQVKLADKLGLRQGLVSGYERGQVRLHAVLLAAFATALRTTPNEILGFEKIKENGTLDRRFLSRIEDIEKLSRRDKQTLLRTIDRFVRHSG